MLKKIILLVLLILQISTYTVYATENNIILLDNKASEKELLYYSEEKLMLNKNWYTYTFEIDPGKNSFMNAADKNEYSIAIKEVIYPLEKIQNYKIYFLDYKLKNYSQCMALSFLDSSTVVFGTFVNASKENIHKLAVHELGHQLDFQLMDEKKWEQYRKLRGISNKNIFSNSGSIYGNRPQEIFAEDFRLLFSGEKGKKDPHLNTKIEHPETVRGLKEFFLSL